LGIAPAEGAVVLGVEPEVLSGIRGKMDSVAKESRQGSSSRIILPF